MFDGYAFVHAINNCIIDKLADDDPKFGTLPRGDRLEKIAGMSDQFAAWLFDRFLSERENPVEAKGT